MRACTMNFRRYNSDVLGNEAETSIGATRSESNYSTNRDINHGVPRKCIQHNKQLRVSATPSIWLTVLATILVLHFGSTVNRCDAKEFDWSDLGVSLANSKSSPPQNNLRILVSPQRRMTKGYDYDYSSGNQTSISSGHPEGATYMVPNSAGSTYLTQSSGQPSQSAAYSALSASLATLKNRLSARGVTLSQTLSDNGSSLYSAPSTYGSSSLIVDQNQQGQQPVNQHVGQEQTQPTYLSVPNQQDSQGSQAQYTLPPPQSSDNKTIVLAIPAKINFLTDGRSSNVQKQQTYQQQQPQSTPQAQQVTVIQSPNEQQPRQEYGAKQMEPSEQSRTQIIGDANQELTSHQSYVIVNQPTGQSNDPHSHLIAANLNPASIGQMTPQMYSSAVYQQAQLSPIGSYAMKYIPTYQTAAISQPTVQKLYSSVVDHPSAGGAYEIANESPITSNRYTSCLDTCNSADPRWRKYTVSKYKTCCSRSSLYDASFEQPSADRVSELGSKYSEDAYYNYLYRRTRARRSRRQRNRYPKHHSSAQLSAPVNDEEMNQEEPPAKHVPSRQTYSASGETSYMKFHKTRQPAGVEDTIGSQTSSDSTPLSSRYEKLERQYKRGSRAREVDSSTDPPPSGSGDSSDDEPMYSTARGSGGYGSAEYSIDGRYPNGARPQANEDEDIRSFDESPDPDKSFSVDTVDYSAEPNSEVSQEREESEPDMNEKLINQTRRKKQIKLRTIMRERKLEKEGKTHRKGRKMSVKQRKFETYATSQSNATDYEPTQVSPEAQGHEPGIVGEDEQAYTRDAGNESGSEVDKEAMTNKYRQSLNDSTVANLSKTTMHLKEILSLLEKKAQLRTNDTSYPGQTTSTPAPTTTTTVYSSHSYLGGAPLSLQPSEYMTAELSLKSPYRLEPPSLSSGLSSSGLHLGSPYASIGSDSYSSPYVPSHYNAAKHLALQSMHHSRKRRVPKVTRYNHVMYPKAQGGYAPTSSLMQPNAIKNPLLNPTYYSTMNYPYIYGRGSQSTTSSYPYKSIHKNPAHSAPLQSASKLQHGGGFYSDESRLHGLISYDPLANVASVLRPSGMRIRNKPFLLHSPHHVYARQPFLPQILERD